MVFFAVVYSWEVSVLTTAPPLLLLFEETRSLETSLIPATVTLSSLLSYLLEVVCFNIA